MTQWLKAVAVLQCGFHSPYIYDNSQLVYISSSMENNSPFCPLWALYTHGTHRLIHII